MSDTVNPFKGPETVAAPLSPLTAQGTLTETMLKYLKNASPWLRFIGVLGFIGSGITVLWGIISMAFGSFTWRVLKEIPGFKPLSEISSTGGTALMLLTGLLTFGMAAIIFIPALFTYKFGSMIRSYLRTGADQDLELALKSNKSLWKFRGIIYIIYLAFVPLTVVIGIIVAVASALS